MGRSLAVRCLQPHALHSGALRMPGQEQEPSHSSATPTSLALPWSTKLFTSFFSFITDAARRPNGTVNRFLLSLLQPTARPNPKPVRGVRTADVTVDPARDLWFRLYLPEAPSSDNGGGGGRLPVLVFFHGGGFVYFSPSLKVFDDFCRRLCREIPAVVVSVNYRLAPEHRCPAAYDDGFDVLRFLASRGGGDGGPPNGSPLLRELFEVADLSSCFLAGDSAGGNLAHHVARRWTAGAPPDPQLALAGVVAIQPFFGGEERVDSEIRLAGAPMVNTEGTDWAWKAFLPEGAGRDHEMASPEGAATGLGEGFPPAMVVVGGFDPLHDWQRRYYEGLRRAGKEARLVEYPGSFHGFYAFPELKDATALTEELREFIEERRQQQGPPDGDKDGGVHAKD